MNERQVRRTRDGFAGFAEAIGWTSRVFLAELQKARDVQVVIDQGPNSWTATVTGTLTIEGE